MPMCSSTGEKPYPCEICGTRFRHLPDSEEATCESTQRNLTMYVSLLWPLAGLGEGGEVEGWGPHRTARFNLRHAVG